MKKKTLKECTEFIARWEGFTPTVYKCPAGKDTFGYGFTVDEFSAYMPTKTKPMSERSARDLLKEVIITKYYEPMMEDINVPLTEGQKIALTSFCYNLGVETVKKRSENRKSIVDQLNDGEYEAVSKRMLLYNKVRVGGKLIVIEGLVRRRQAEQDLFLRKDLQNPWVELLKKLLTLISKEVS